MSIRSMTFSTIIMGILFVTAGCALNQDIKYNINDIQESNNSRLRSYTLSIMEFSDSRRADLENNILFSHGKEAWLEDGTYCINSEKHYKKENVAKQIASKFVDHLNKKNIFKSVTLNNREQSDFYLTGNVYKFYGKQEFSHKSAIGSQFGLLGALATIGTKTKGSTEIIIKDLSIYDKNNNIIAMLDDINEVFNGDFRADAYCWHIYGTVNEKLKEAIEKEISHMEEKLSKIIERNYSKL